VSGTSFSAPLTASVITLLYDINPCFSASDIENIIKNSAKPITDASSFTGNLGGGRIDAYSAVLAAKSYGVSLPITSNTIWNTDRFVAGDLVIESGATLTINNSSIIKFDGQGRVVVKPGGKLVVDNATLTNACSDGSRWRGIRVWGNPNQRQINSQQGLVILQNNATIEGSQFGISTRDGNDLLSKNGGIIQAKNTTFKNNEFDAEILPYRNFHATNPSHELKNRSYFFDCLFTTDYGIHYGSDGSDGKVYIPTPHIYLRDVNGIRFLGCTFEDKWANFKYRTGIMSSFASFELNELCTGTVSTWPPAQTCNGKKTKFINLKQGIKAYYLNNASVFSIKIKNSEFNCNKAVYFGGINNSIVALNNFNTSTTVITPNVAGNYYGLYLEYCENYEIQENNFEVPTFSNAPNGAAIVVHNSHSYSTELYKNKFINCKVGIEALGQNKTTNSLTKDGLKIKCNTFNSSNTDIYVRQNIIYPAPVIGISQQQGYILMSGSNATNSDALAGNLFTQNSSSLASNFNNIGDYINYAHHNVSSNPLVRPFNTKYTSGTIGLYENLTTSYVSTQGCSSKLVPSPIGVIHILQSSSTSSISLLQAQLNILLDGGDPGLDDDISMTTSAEVYEQYLELRNEDGFLSIDVLRELIENMEFTNVMVRNILVANSHGAKEDEIQELLDLRPQMPSYMRYQINTSMKQLSALEFIEGQIGYYQNQYNQAIAEELKFYREDSIPNQDSIVATLIKAIGINWKYELANHYKSNGDVQLALDVLDEIGYSLPPNSEELQIHNDYTNFHDQFDVTLNSDSIDQLDSLKIEELTSLIGNNHYINREVLAILILNNVSAYDEPVFIPGDGGENEMNEIRPFIPSRSGELFIYPNPSSQFTTISYKIDNFEGQLSYILLSTDGKVVKSSLLENTEDEFLINVTKFASGNYVLILKDENRVIIGKKLKIVH
jgi:hypothetical protein